MVETAVSMLIFMTFIGEIFTISLFYVRYYQMLDLVHWTTRNISATPTSLTVDTDPTPPIIPLPLPSGGEITSCSDDVRPQVTARLKDRYERLYGIGSFDSSGITVDNASLKKPSAPNYIPTDPQCQISVQLSVDALCIFCSLTKLSLKVVVKDSTLIDSNYFNYCKCATDPTC